MCRLTEQIFSKVSTIVLNLQRGGKGGHRGGSCPPPTLAMPLKSKDFGYLGFEGH